MSYQVSLEGTIKSEELKLIQLNDELTKINSLQNTACSRGQCGGADFEAGIVPYQFDQERLRKQISLSESNLTGLRYDLSKKQVEVSDEIENKISSDKNDFSSIFNEYKIPIIGGAGIFIVIMIILVMKRR